MDARINYVILVIVGLFAGLAGAQPEGSSATDVNETAVTDLPYVATVTGNNVYVRSGPGQNFYFCSQLNKGDTVTVVGEQFEWARIVPTAGSFSWISMRYVKVSPTDRSTGIVTAGSAKVYIGSDFFDPLRSDVSKVELERGDEVELLGERKSDYYKIEPPKGEYRWISREYIRRVSKPSVSAGVPEGPNDANAGRSGEAEDVSVEAEAGEEMPARLKKFYSLQEKIAAERKEPIDEQDYGPIKRQLRELAEAEDEDKASKYAGYALKQVERCELALRVDKMVRQQDAELREALENIEKQRQERLAEHQELGQYAAMGQLRESNIFAADYRVVDEQGDLECYASPSGSVSKAEVEGLLGKKVGLKGQIKPHPESGGVLVRFTAIEQIR